MFIITWCDKSIEWLKEFFIKEIKQNGYKPYFQEDNEPTGEISSEIRERIANCSFVVCDLTGMRPNCIYELGLAHAVHKRTIMTIKKDNSFIKTIDGKEVPIIPFDINQYKHSFWEKPNDEKFEADIRNRIKQTNEAINQDYWL